MNRILNHVDDAIRTRKKKVYLHCHGGIGRTGTAIGCYLVRHGTTATTSTHNHDDGGNNGSHAALQELNRMYQASGRSRECPHSPETESQKMFVMNWIDCDCGLD